MADELRIIDNDVTQYIVVGLGNEQYGIDIKYIDNIVRMQRITRVPKSAEYFRGVINLRGGSGNEPQDKDGSSRR